MVSSCYMSPLHFLIVDDDATSRLLMKMRLWKMQISEENIKTACDGAMALSVLSQPSDKTAVVITDLEMPSKNGYELITSLRKESHLRHLKIILTTGVDRREDAELDKFLRLHFIVYYLRKDEVTPEKLQTALEKIFDR